MPQGGLIVGVIVGWGVVLGVVVTVCVPVPRYPSVRAALIMACATGGEPRKWVSSLLTAPMTQVEAE